MSFGIYTPKHIDGYVSIHNIYYQVDCCRSPARGRIWPYYGDKEHPVILYDYTATRERAGPAKFLEGYRGYLQADAYGGYDAFFKDPARGLIEVGCMAHCRRYFHKALESDQARMGPALLLIAQLYKVEDRARALTSEARLGLRQLHSRPILHKLHE
jgi:hypothetical protein